MNTYLKHIKNHLKTHVTGDVDVRLIYNICYVSIEKGNFCFRKAISRIEYYFHTGVSSSVIADMILSEYKQEIFDYYFKKPFIKT